MIDYLATSQSTGVPLAALIVSAAALAYGALSGSRKASNERVTLAEERQRHLEEATNEYVHQLENRLEDHEGRLKACEAARESLMHENLALLRDLRNAPPPATVVVHTGDPNHPEVKGGGES